MENKRTSSPHHNLVFVAMQAIFILYSFSGIASKTAAQQAFMSPSFIGWYVVMVGVLGVYAVVWQQIIKRVPLTTAYANKAITIVWGLVWGAVLFHEQISPLKILGATIVLMGVIAFVRADAELTDETNPKTEYGGEAQALAQDAVNKNGGVSV